jgi:hypothetical protein
MPRLSDTMTEGTVATWLKKVGDKIKISLLKLKPTKQLWNLNPSMKELFYTLEFQGRNSTCRFAIGYHR